MIRFQLIRKTVFATLCAGAFVFAHSANAANPESVAAEVEFVAPVTIAENSSLRFGLIDVNFAASELITVDPDNTVSADAGGNVLGGTQGAANLTVGATTAQAITILVDNLVNGSGYTMGSFMCNYDGGTDTACDGGGLSTTSATSAVLLIGATITQAGTPGAGIDNGTFDVTITYN